MATVRKIFGSGRTAFGSREDMAGLARAGAAGLAALPPAATAPAHAWRGSSMKSRQAVRRRIEFDMQQS